METKIGPKFAEIPKEEDLPQEVPELPDAPLADITEPSPPAPSLLMPAPAPDAPDSVEADQVEPASLTEADAPSPEPNPTLEPVGTADAVEPASLTRADPSAEPDTPTPEPDDPVAAEPTQELLTLSPALLSPSVPTDPAAILEIITDLVKQLPATAPEAELMPAQKAPTEPTREPAADPQPQHAPDRSLDVSALLTLLPALNVSHIQPKLKAELVQLVRAQLQVSSGKPIFEAWLSLLKALDPPKTHLTAPALLQAAHAPEPSVVTTADLWHARKLFATALNKAKSLLPKETATLKRLLPQLFQKADVLDAPVLRSGAKAQLSFTQALVQLSSFLNQNKVTDIHVLRMIAQSAATDTAHLIPRIHQALAYVQSLDQEHRIATQRLPQLSGEANLPAPPKASASLAPTPSSNNAEAPTFQTLQLSPTAFLGQPSLVRNDPLRSLEDVFTPLAYEDTVLVKPIEEHDQQERHKDQQQASDSEDQEDNKDNPKRKKETKR